MAIGQLDKLNSLMFFDTSEWLKEPKRRRKVLVQQLLLDLSQYSDTITLNYILTFES